MNLGVAFFHFIDKKRSHEEKTQTSRIGKLGCKVDEATTLVAWPFSTKDSFQLGILNLRNVNFGPRDPDFVKGDSKEKL